MKCPVSTSKKNGKKVHTFDQKSQNNLFVKQFVIEVKLVTSYVEVECANESGVQAKRAAPKPYTRAHTHTHHTVQFTVSFSFHSGKLD